MNLADLGGRKIIAGLVIVLLGIGALLKYGDIPANFLQLLQVVFGAFVLGNAAEHAANAYAGSDEESHDKAESQQLEVIAQSIVDLDTKLNKAVESTATTQAALSMIITKYGIDKTAE